MKRSMCFLSVVLCLFLVSCQTAVQDNYDWEEVANQEIQIEQTVWDEVADTTLPDEIVSDVAPLDDTESDELPSDEEVELWDDDMPEYVKAYMEFLLYDDMDSDSDFPIRGYYLFDLNFDDIPELGILHDSWGSMGGYFTLYYYDGNGISRILNDRGEPVQISNYTQILADYEQKKVYLLKEMYLLVGNENGTYGYVREIRSAGQVPCVYDILNLYVDQKIAMERIREGNYGNQHENEDGFLLDSELEECLAAQRYSGEEWLPISTSEYWKLKRELIPEDNSFVDVRRNEDLKYLGEANYDDDGYLLDVKMEKEEIEQLFRLFMQ
ncbi:MAG: hypothetical protein K2N85_15890 [Lachnospiraceae bacterium]|nr:hypothetical protein [Lachnospiraceae bacterium]